MSHWGLSHLLDKGWQGWCTSGDAGEKHFRIAQDFYAILNGGCKDEKKERIWGVWGEGREQKGPLTQKQGLVSAVVCPCLDHHSLSLYLLKFTFKCFPARDFPCSVCVPACLPVNLPAAGVGLRPWEPHVQVPSVRLRKSPSAKSSPAAGWIQLMHGSLMLLDSHICSAVLPSQTGSRTGLGVLPVLWECPGCLLLTCTARHLYMCPVPAGNNFSAYQLGLGTQSGSSPVFLKLSGPAWYTLYIWNFQFQIPPREWPAVLTGLSRSAA